MPLLDAYLWVKTPGESDGACNRGVAGATTDPEWGGTTGAFADPDGYVWEVAHNPGWTLDERGAITI